MTMKSISYDLVGQVLAKDVFTDQGLLLLTAGTQLQAKNIEALLNQGVLQIEVSPPSVSAEIELQMKSLGHKQQEQILAQNYLTSLEQTKTLFQQAVNGEIPRLDEFMQTYAPLLEHVLESTYLFHPIHKIRGHDEYNYRHSLNVGLISAIIGKLLGLTMEENFLLGQMGLFHDIGKMKVSNDVLFKPGRLNSEEYAEIKRHTEYGYELLREMPGTDEIICLGALHHHERLDGSGYPRGLKEEDIPFYIQILSVGDTYDAICSDRIYQRKSSPYFAVKEMMKEAYSGRLNARIVVPFVRYIMEAYVGEKALLNNGTVAEVIYLHPEEPDRPLLRSGNDYIDLRKQRTIQILDLIAE